MEKLNRTRFLGILVLSSLLFFNCSNAQQDKASEKNNMDNQEKNLTQESVATFVTSLNAWYKNANETVARAFEMAASEVELEEGGEWSGDVEYEASDVNNTALRELEGSILLDSGLKDKWKSALDQAVKANKAYGLGSLFLMGGKFQQDSWGIDMDEFSAASKGIKIAKDGKSATIKTDPMPMNGATSWQGVLALEIELTGTEVVLVGSSYSD